MPHAYSIYLFFSASLNRFYWLFLKKNCLYSVFMKYGNKYKFEWMNEWMNVNLSHLAKVTIMCILVNFVSTFCPDKIQNRLNSNVIVASYIVHISVTQWHSGRCYLLYFLQGMWDYAWVMRSVMVYKVLWCNMLPIKQGTLERTTFFVDKCR